MRISIAALLERGSAPNRRGRAGVSPREHAESQSIRRFWQSARGFLTGGAGWCPWGLIGLLVVGVILQLAVQYRLNLWNRDFFNALELKDGSVVWQQAETLLVLAALSVGLAILAVWGRMTFQRKWRDWLTAWLLAVWTARAGGRSEPAAELDLAEYRIAEDARIATDAPIDFMVGLLTSVLTAGTFITVLWTVGGSFDLSPVGLEMRIPGYLVVAVIIYSAVMTSAMMLVGGKMAPVIERKNEAESELKSAIARLRENLQGESAGETVRPTNSGLRTSVGAAVNKVISAWRRLCGQHMRTTLVSHGNSLLAPFIGIIFCVPNYVHGGMSLGEMTQSAAAFVAVQSAFNWLVDNYSRLAEWSSSSSRVGVLLLRLDEAIPEDGPAATEGQRESRGYGQRRTKKL